MLALMGFLEPWPLQAGCQRVVLNLFRHVLPFFGFGSTSCNILTLDIANTLAGTGSLAASTTALLAIYRSRTM